MSARGQLLGTVLPPNVWTTAMAMDVFETNTKTWAFRNVGANPITDAVIEVSMIALDGPDADWILHPEQPPAIKTVAPGAWATGTTRNYAYNFYRLRLLSALGSKVDCYMGAR